MKILLNPICYIFVLVFHVLSISCIHSLEDSELIFSRHESTINLPNPVHKQVKIAYLFAGSTRSLICPKVHWSIRLNLIDSLKGNPYVFIRMSKEDNLNTKTGDGKIEKVQYNESEIISSLHLLNPVEIEYYSLSDELLEMEQKYENTDHKVIRKWDRRRYSMYYHRSQSYQMLLRYERKYRMKFDWVVLVRLDAAWLDPVYPIQSYLEDRVWLTETGFEVFNDQFMLIPRTFSDQIYDLDSKVSKNVYCLGGPDVEKWKCNLDGLMEHNVSKEEAKQVLSYCCSDVQDVDRQGYSEKINFRHFRYWKIPVSITRFPVYLTRLKKHQVCYPECMRISSLKYNKFLFLFDKALYPFFKDAIWPDTRGRAVSSRDKSLCYIINDENANVWNPIKASDSYHFHLNFSLPIIEQIQHSEVKFQILIDEGLTRAYRIHPTWNKNGCLTYLSKFSTTFWKNCIDHNRNELRYDTNQIYFFRLNHQPPRLGPTASRPSHISPRYDVTRIVMLSSTRKRSVYYNHLVMCLTSESSHIHSSINFQPCSRNASFENQLFLSVNISYEGSSLFSNVGKIHYAANPELCVSRIADESNPGFVLPPSGKLVLDLCVKYKNMDLVFFEFEYIE